MQVAQGPRGRFAASKGSVLRSIFIRDIAVIHSEWCQSPSPRNAHSGHQRVLQGLDPPKLMEAPASSSVPWARWGRDRLGPHTDIFSHRVLAGWPFQMTNKPCTSKSCKGFLSILDTSCGLTLNKQRHFGKGEAQRARVMQVEQLASNI